MQTAKTDAQATAPLIKAVDHLTIRVDDAHYDQLFGLLTDTFQLPVAWPPSERYPGDPVGFKSGGIAAGPIPLELFRVGPRPLAQAQLYSIAFATRSSVPACLHVLDARAIPHLPPLAVPQDRFGEEGMLWTLIILGDLFNPDLAALPSLAPGTSGRSILSLRFDQAFHQGMAFVCVYNAATYDVAQQQAQGQATLRARDGGPLGLVELHEIVVGAANVAVVQPQWQRLFAPLRPANAAGWRRLFAPFRPPAPARWQFGEGPAIRLVSAAHDGIVGLVWRVRSLDQARAFLRAHGMLGQSARRQLAIAPARMLGLEIRLVE
jgi:hypothetical protein